MQNLSKVINSTMPFMYALHKVQSSKIWLQRQHNKILSSKYALLFEKDLNRSKISSFPKMKSKNYVHTTE